MRARPPLFALDGGSSSARRVAVARVLVLVSMALGACTPRTDLTKDAPGGGSAVTSPSGTLVDPLAGAADVPTNLAAVTVRFPGAIALPPAALGVCGASATAVADAAPCAGGICYTATLGAPLPARATCRVELAAGAVNGAGGAVPTGLIGTFETSAEADDTPPTISGVTVQVTGPCVAVSFATDEVATGTVVLAVGDTSTETPAGAGATTFDVAIPVGALPAQSAATVTVRAVDRAGNVAASAPLAWQTPAALPPVAITEVLANPAGPEPAQEYVELRNLGQDAVPTDGLSLADSRGADALPSATLEPGAYALVVTSSYDPAQGADTPPRAGTQLLRVDSRLGADGLSNGGEVTRLLEGDAVVSSYGGWVDVSSVAWVGKSVQRLVESACDTSDAWNHTPLPATPGAGPP
jgi:hypothetical protein